MKQIDTIIKLVHLMRIPEFVSHLETDFFLNAMEVIPFQFHYILSTGPMKDMMSIYHLWPLA